MPNARMDSRLVDMNDNQLKRLVSEFHDQLPPYYRRIVTQKDLELMTYAFMMQEQHDDFLKDYMLSEFSDLRMTRRVLKTSNDFALVMVGYLNYLMKDESPNYPVIRYDEPMQGVVQYYGLNSIISSSVDLSFKNLMNYGMLLLDLGMIIQNPYLNDTPMKTVVHGLALTSMFCMIVYEYKVNHWPSLEDLRETFDSQLGESIGSRQYRQLLNHLLDEVSGSVPPDFFKAHRRVIKQLNRLKLTEEWVRAIPRLYFGGLILAPVTVPLAMAIPLINLGDGPREAQPYDNALCLSLAVYFVSFIFLAASDDMTEFLKEFMYCEKDACFVEEAQYTAAAFGGGSASVLSFLIYVVYDYLKACYQDSAFNTGVTHRVNHSYRSFRAAPSERIGLLSEHDIEMGAVSGQGPSIHQ